MTSGVPSSKVSVTPTTVLSTLQIRVSENNSHDWFIEHDKSFTQALQSLHMLTLNFLSRSFMTMVIIEERIYVQV